MGLSLVTGPTTEPVTLAEAKAHCRIAIADDDGLLAGYILAAREHCESYTRRAFLTQSWTYKIDRDWPIYRLRGVSRHQIRVPLPPLLSVSSITYVDTAGTTQTLAADQYRTDSTAFQGLIEPAYGVIWPCVRDQLATITVSFTAGYGSNPGSPPNQVRQAMLLLIGHWYENREQVVIGQAPTEIPFGVESLLHPLRVLDL